jgi:predicted N-acetyltransferase YhbS
MTEDDVTGADQAWHDAYTTMRSNYHLPVESRTADSAQRSRERIAHLLRTDPAGSWVAEDDDQRVVGLSQAVVREGVWVLSLLGVSPDQQNRGTGKALLDAALTHGQDAPAGLILCSRDPRAMRRYARAGFDLHPAVTAWGTVDRRKLLRVPAVRDAAREDVDFVANLDRRLRGGAHGPDLECLLVEGCRLLVVPGRGYVVARDAKPVLLAADDEETAADLLHACLASAGDDDIVEVNWITARQQWAVRVAVDLGLDLHPVGPVMTRGLDGPPYPYLPSGAFG